MRFRRLLLPALAAGSLLVVADATPASAALPGLACANYTAPYFCMGFDGLNVTAAASNPGPSGQCFNFACTPVRIQLVFFAPGAATAKKLSETAPVTNFAAGPVIRTAPVATWQAGTYCVREYSRVDGKWYDNLCLSTTTGQRVPGSYGTTTPGL